MKKVIMAMAICLMIAGVSFAEGNIKAGYFLNYQDNEFKPVLATSLKEWTKTHLSIDLWATDLDDLIQGISNDWEGGLGLTYTLPTKIENLNISLGYGIGARSPFSENHELIQGGLAFGIKIKF